MKRITFDKILILAVLFIVGYGSYTLHRIGRDDPFPPFPPIQLEKEVKKEVSVLAEAENCKKAGGKFMAIPDVKNISSTKEEITFTSNNLNLSCTKFYKEGNKKITETLFEYKLEY